VLDHLALVACGAPLAARVHDVAALAVHAGWVVWVVATPSAMNWVDAAQVETITGFPVLVEQRQPGLRHRPAKGVEGRVSSAWLSGSCRGRWRSRERVTR
jgi:hypothetical protein